MQITLIDGLPFVQAHLVYQKVMVQIDFVLIDTGSASTLFSADVVAQANLMPEPNDKLRTLRGVGGTEVVFTRPVDRPQVGSGQIENFEVEIGGMDYGFNINGILGMDFLRQTGAVLDLRRRQLSFVK